MADLIEVVARALAKLDARTDENWEAYVGDARVVVLATLRELREPSPGMILANSENGGLEFSQHVIDDWRAMIDQAIAEYTTPLVTGQKIPHQIFGGLNV